MSADADRLAAEHARLVREIEDSKRELRDSAHGLVAEPMQRLDESRERLGHFVRQYSLLLLPIAVLAALNPRRTLAVVGGVLRLWLAWRAPPRPGSRGLLD